MAFFQKQFGVLNPMGVEPKIGGKPPKMDGSNGKPYEKWMIWGYPYFWKHPYRHPVIPPEVNGVLGIFLGVQIPSQFRCLDV